ncbi:MAG TPA: hypothetical protein DCR46_03590 [Cytophagales bacterium]|nr:hypothetical protein [Cytophagales bacterium]
MFKIYELSYSFGFSDSPCLSSGFLDSTLFKDCQIYLQFYKLTTEILLYVPEWFLSNVEILRENCLF